MATLLFTQAVDARIANAAAGLGGILSHADVEATAQGAQEGGVRILRGFLELLAGSSGPG